MRDKVTRQCPQTPTFEEKGQPKQIRTKVLLLTSLTPYRYARPAHTRMVEWPVLKYCLSCCWVNTEIYLFYVAWNKVTVAWLYGVHRMIAKAATVSHDTSHATTKQHCMYTTLVDLKTCCVKLVTDLALHATQCSGSAQKQRLAYV